jgi:hypothetical protein
MPRVRLELDQRTFEALTQAAVQERRPIPWHAELLIQQVLGTRSNHTVPSAGRLKDQEVAR